MKILSIETSCDETAISIVEARGGLKNPQFTVLSNITLSQAKLHAKYGGVFPNLAKREHSRNLIPVLKQVLKDARMLTIDNKQLTIDKKSQRSNVKGQMSNASKILTREPELLEQFLEFIPKIKKPQIDKIAVTYGPGLEPALWVGINFAKALSLVWDVPLIPVNHMEGHIASVLPLQNRGSSKSKTLNPKQALSTKSKTLHPKPYTLNPNVVFPAVALLISGGHTELVLVKKWVNYKILGQTRDDAVGETYDKVARMLDLPYPGGPEISHLAQKARSLKIKAKGSLPRPMIDSANLDFSFAGLKTAVLYYLQRQPAKNIRQRQEIAREFEDAVSDVLISKTKKAMNQTNAKTLIIAGGVSANKFLREKFKKEFNKTAWILIPPYELSTDNALMIAMAGYIKSVSGKKIISSARIKAEGNLSLS